MRLLVKLFVCLCLLPASIFCQERIRKVMVGPLNDQVRILVAFVEPSEESLKTESLIIDLAPIKNNQEQPAFVVVDLTSTVRNLSTGGKNQKILQLRWKKAEKIELKCDGKWITKDSEPATDKIVEATRAVIRIIPLNTKDPTEFTLTEEAEQKIVEVLKALNPKDLPCLRVLN